MKLIVNGKEREVATTEGPVMLDKVLAVLELRADRVAVELNGELRPRAGWATTEVRPGDRLEVVHFVGGGSAGEARVPGAWVTDARTTTRRAGNQVPRSAQKTRLASAFPAP